MAKKKEVDSLWSAIKFDAAGLIPAVVQERGSGRVFMLAYMNRESLELTLKTGFTHFFSRSRQALWKKGETSGHTQRVESVRLDCDGDTLIVEVEQTGPACHTGEPTCFFRLVDGEQLTPDPDGGGAVLDRVYRVIQDRKAHPVEGSYVASLLAGGVDRILKKVAEEAGEVVLASKNGARDQIVWEVADLWFHTLVALGHHDIPPSAIYDELTRRFTHRAPAPRKRPATKPKRALRKPAR
ncbi:MAG TPA: bifunctional phosphoribosyl-AMP cyclohydrolase/phosphoribosyl-ATP diphosphatase HisIE [Nitrospiria bacterium]|nr:bifunctional phosphoribosyl-AMP cyclohydrolase/phosphoribosyl-ATP diphosphatase HisIE [Nitrospiria bacterium]